MVGDASIDDDEGIMSVEMVNHELVRFQFYGLWSQTREESRLDLREMKRYLT